MKIDPPLPAPLTEWKIVDLTQPLIAGLPLWPCDPKFTIKPWASYERNHYFINHKQSVSTAGGTGVYLTRSSMVGAVPYDPGQ